MNWFGKILTKLETPVEDNPLDNAIVDKLPSGDNQHIQEVYKARWVWYHTILAVEIAFTNILLIAILILVAFK